MEYYKVIRERIGVAAEECLMVGNDVGEDMITEDLMDYLAELELV